VQTYFEMTVNVQEKIIPRKPWGNNLEQQSITPGFPRGWWQEFTNRDVSIINYLNDYLKRFIVVVMFLILTSLSSLKQVP